MWRRFVQLRALSFYEWWLMFISMQLLPLIALLLRLFGYRRTKSFIIHFIPGESSLLKPGEQAFNEALVVARMVSIAGRYGPYRANCLKQSLLLWFLLARHGIFTEICLGVEKESEKEFGAHAWVECAGINLSDSEEVQKKFAVLEKKEFVNI